MGNILQRHASESDGLVTPKIVALTPKEVDIIKETWKIPSANTHDSAELIFYTFLERFPENQPKFVDFKDIPLKELKGTPGFRAHSARIFNVFSSVIDALDKDPELKGIKKIIADVGKHHAKRRISKKSQNDVRGVITEIITDVCKLDDEGKVAWTKLLDIFFHIIYECADGRSDLFY